MDHESKQANEIADEYVTPNVVIEYKMKVVPVIDGTHLDAGRVVSADVTVVEPEDDEYGVLLTLTYAPNVVAFERKQYQTVDFALESGMAKEMATDMVGHAMNANSAIIHEFTYVTSPEELEAGELKKLSLWYETSNASPIAAMILEEAERAISGNI